MLVRSTQVMPSRPCKYCLALQDDSVFADFDLDEQGCLYLVRISFDGYGCDRTDPENRPAKMSLEHSLILIQLIEKDNLNENEAAEILAEYFRANRMLLWEDALLAHGLI